MHISLPLFWAPRFIAAIALLAGFMALAAYPRPAAAIEIDVTPGNINPLPIALPAFIGGSQDAQELGANITSVIANDLGRSGFFNPLPPESYIEQITSFEQEPRFADWRQIQAKALVTGQAVMEGGK
jgi:TolB protein